MLRWVRIGKGTGAGFGGGICLAWAMMGCVVVSGDDASPNYEQATTPDPAVASPPADQAAPPSRVEPADDPSTLR